MQVDPQLPHNTPDAATFWELFKSLLPPIVLNFLMGMLLHVRDAFKERTWKGILIVLTIYASAAAAVGPMVMVGAHELFPNHSHMSHMMAGCAVGAICPQLFASWFRRKAKQFIINLDDPNDIDSCRQGMTPEERARHANTCPFESDRYEGRCMQCPHSEHYSRQASKEEDA